MIIWLVGTLWVSNSMAQSITTGTLTSDKICTGSAIQVPYGTSGAFGAGNNFTVQLSDASGSFASPTNLAPSATTNPLAVIVPVGTPNGTAYKVRVVSSNPVIVGTASGTVLTIQNTPTAPTVPQPSVSYCVGETAATLTATAAGGNTLKWYNSADAPLASAPTPSTASAGAQLYKVSQITSAGCESPKTNITVVVNATPAAPTATSPVAICEGAPASPLTASGSNLKWYSSSNTLLPGAPTPSNTTASTYLVSQTVNNCESPKRTVEVTITSKPTPPGVTSPLTYCYGATVPVLTATGSGLKWYDASNNALAGAPTPSNTSSSSYGVTRTTAGCESDKATINVNITRTAAPTVTSPVTYCISETPSALTATGTALKWYNAANNPLASAPTPSTASAGTTTYYVTQTLNGCESDQKAQINVVVNARPAAPGVSNVTYCQNATPSALTATGSNLRWYTAASGGSGSATAPTPSTATAGTTSYYVSQTNGSGCESTTRSQLNVIVNPKPVAPAVAAALIEYCRTASGATALSATATAGHTLKWYLPNGSTTATAPTPSTATAGDLNYKVSQTNASGCESDLVDIKVTIYALPASPGVSNLEVCQTKESTTLTLTATGSNLKWYAAASGGTGEPTAPTIDRKDVLATKSYFVSQTSANGCEGPRAELKVRVKPLPGLPAVIAAAAYCQADSPQALSASPSTGGSLRWYGTSATGGTGSLTAPSPSTGTAGVTTYYVSQVVEGCESDRAPITVTIRATPAPTADPLVEYCRQATASPLTAQGTNLKWYTVATGGTSSTAAPTPSTANVTTTSYYVTQTQGFAVGAINLSCESTRTKIDVTINPLPGLPSVTNAVECQTRQPQNLALQANGSNLQWYTAATGGTASTNTPQVNLANAGETSYFVSQVTAKGCEGSRAELKVRIKRLPTLPGVSPVEYCQFDNASPLTATLENQASVNWYGTSSEGGNRSDNAPVPSTQNGGETFFYVSQTLEGCEGDRSSIRVFIKTTPKPGVTPSLAYCQNVTAPPLAAQGENLKWYRASNTGEFQTTPFTPFTANVGEFSFFVTQTGSNGCESPKEEIKVRVKPLPSATITGDNSISLGGSTQITVTFTGDGPWTYVLSNGLQATTSDNPIRITVSPERTTTYLVTEVANECGKGSPNGSALVTVLIPTISTGNPTVASLCAGTAFTLPFQQSGEFVPENKFNVQVSRDTVDRNFYSIPSVQNGNEVVATIPDTTRGGNYFVRVVGESPLFTIKGSTSPVNVTIRPLPTATLTGEKTILIGESTDLSVALTGDGPWTFTFNNGQRDTLITTSVSTYILTVKPETTTVYRVISVTNPCGTSVASGTVRIQVDPILGTEPVVTTQWLQVYPNPVSTLHQTCTLDITVPLVAGQAQLQIFDMNGRRVMTKTLRTARSEIDFSTQPAGMYLLRVENGGRTAVQRIFKQH
ncbi:T9SS type A sorting domain-containing protein [Rhabdobacter roseus]|nr:T9SS type A sorting domain-containing protein [Rhabdobacter roseus]